MKARPWLLAALHLALLASVGGKLLVDRAVRPRYWLRAAPVDPSLPVRGRYLSLRVQVPLAGPPGRAGEELWVRLRCEPQGLAAVPERDGAGLARARLAAPGVAELSQPLAFFIPEHGPDPSGRPELWVEVTVPRSGPPRPIRLGSAPGAPL